jgi:hypothetical protein
MKLKDVKKLLNSLSKEQLEQGFIYMSNNYYISGEVNIVKKCPATLYYTGEDDPSKLYTRKQLIEEEGLDKEEIKRCEVEIHKGAIVAYLD